ncbi:conjugal transfer protein [Mycobacterium camsae]|uniref:conjugal transfer protein n=1 Tax=Mycobacterium gordonae TaxID=1778 RepID=UPI00197E5BB7|nr:conjugal transfer protein [Mycobacterium gordonae]
MMTNTWRKRLEHSHTLLRRAASAVGIGSCAIVAIATIWGWITDEPIDVAGPARTAVNRTALIGSYAQDCVTRWLTATQADQQSLHECWTLRDPLRLPTTPAFVVNSPAVSAVTLVSDTGETQQWSVVVSVSERPFQAATPRTTYYRLPVVYTSYGVRASALPARVNGPGAGADAPLGYPATLPDTSPAFTTVAGFLTSYLTASGGLERYVTPTSGLLPAADYRSVQLTRLTANRNTPDHDVPAEGTTLHVLAAASAVTNQFAPLQLDYPIVLTVTSGRWTVSALDYAPLLAESAELTPVIPAAAAPR